MDMDYVAVGLAIVIAALWILSRMWATDPMNPRMQVIDEQFRQLRHDNSADPALSYDGNKATVVHDHIEVETRRHEGHVQTLHRVFRNDCGQYFLFISGDPPFVGHLTRERAMNAMRGDPVAFKHEFGEEPQA